MTAETKIINLLASYFKTTSNILQSQNGEKMQRRKTMYLLSQYTDLKQSEIALLMRCHSSTVSYSVAEITRRQREDKYFKAEIRNLGEMIHDKINVTDRRQTIRDVEQILQIQRINETNAVFNSAGRPLYRVY